jgi:hypothetical protein
MKAPIQYKHSVKKYIITLKTMAIVSPIIDSICNIIGI